MRTKIPNALIAAIGICALAVTAGCALESDEAELLGDDEFTSQSDTEGPEAEEAEAEGTAATLQGVHLEGEGTANVPTPNLTCGEWLWCDFCPVTEVHYRHCTSGNDSVRVKAIIDWWDDGACVTVGPNQAKQIDFFPSDIGTFNRIVRC